MASSPSWFSSAPLDRVFPLQPHVSPSPTPAWSSSSSFSEDRIPLSQQRIAGRAPVEIRPAVAGPARARVEIPEETASTMIGQELANIRASYRIPASVRLLLPNPDDRVIFSRPGRVALYEASFKAGLRLPLHPFISNLLDLYSLMPTQLVPNSIRTICSFLVLCHIQGLEAKVSLFRSFYILRHQLGWWLFQPRSGRVLKLGLPTSIKG